MKVQVEFSRLNFGAQNDQKVQILLYGVDNDNVIISTSHTREALPGASKVRRGADNGK